MKVKDYKKYVEEYDSEDDDDYDKDEEDHDDDDEDDEYLSNNESFDANNPVNRF